VGQKQKKRTIAVAKGRSANVMSNAKATRERRARLAATFRARLAAELGPDGSSVGRDALIEAAASAFVEVAELSARFLQGRASDAAMGRLGLARGQLTRTLRLLQVIERDSASEGEGPNDVETEDLDALVERFTGKRKGVTDASANVVEGSTSEPESGGD
jgi:hypothetical protein